MDTAGEETQRRFRVSKDYYSDGTRIITSVISQAKSIEEISQDTGIPRSRCQVRINELVDADLLEAEHDSDLYGHEFIKYRRPMRGALIIR